MGFASSLKMCNFLYLSISGKPPSFVLFFFKPVCGHTALSVLLKSRLWPWPGHSVGQSIDPVCHDCGFDPQFGHIQEITNECINKWVEQQIYLDPSSINKSVKKVKSAISGMKQETSLHILLPI